MDTQRMMIEGLSRPNGMTVDTKASAETQHKFVRLIMSLYLAGYALEYSTNEHNGYWSEVCIFPLVFTYSYRLSNPLHVQTLLDTIDIHGDI